MSKLKTVGAAGLAVPQYVCHGSGVALGGLESGLRWTADLVGQFKDEANAGSEFFAKIREDMDAETRLLEIATLESLHGQDITKPGTPSKDALLVVENAQRILAENSQLKTALALRSQEIEKLLKVKKPSTATQDRQKKQAAALDELKDKRQVEMRAKTGIKDLKLKSLKRGSTGPEIPESEPPEITGSLKTVI